MRSHEPPVPPVDADSERGPPPRVAEGPPPVVARPPRVHIGMRLRSSRPRRYQAGWLASAAGHATVLAALWVALAPADLGGHRGELCLAVSELTETREPEPEPIDPLPTEAIEVAVEPLPTVIPAAVGEEMLVQSQPVPPRPRRDQSGTGDGPRGEFFGTVAYGSRFTFILDVSSSMNRNRNDSTRLKDAVAELIQSVERLTEDQYFYVILFSFKTRLMFDDPQPIPQMIAATSKNKARLRRWLHSIRAGSGTDPRLALRTALHTNASAVFLLSDGEFNGRRSKNAAFALRGNPTVDQVIDAHNGTQTPIHTIAFEERAGSRALEAIATSTGGEYRFIAVATDPDAIARKKMMEQAKQDAARNALRTAMMRYEIVRQKYPRSSEARRASHAIRELQLQLDVEALSEFDESHEDASGSIRE